MLVWTRAQHEQLRRQKQMDDDDSIFQTFGYIDVDEEAVNNTIRGLEQDSRFDKLMEKLLEKQKQKYILMLANSGAKFPQDFNVESLKQDAGTSNNQNTDDPNEDDPNQVNHEETRGDRTRRDHGDTRNQDEARRQHSDKRTYEDARRICIDNPLLTLTQQMQTLQQQI